MKTSALVELVGGPADGRTIEVAIVATVICVAVSTSQPLVFRRCHYVQRRDNRFKFDYVPDEDEDDGEQDL